MTIPETFADHSAVATRAALELPPMLERAVGAVFECLRAGGKILACGNGGSARRSSRNRPTSSATTCWASAALPAIALTGDSATLTALGNDYGFERVFARQVEALARPGDVLLAISTSGNSPNVVRAAQAARSLGCSVIAFTGARGGELAGQTELTIKAPSHTVARIQEVHSLCIHAICEALDELIRAQDTR